MQDNAKLNNLKSRAEHMGSEMNRGHVRWSSQDVLDALAFTSVHFEPFVAEINALNVFPVPDGDTGTNMFLTLKASADATRRDGNTAFGSVNDVYRAAAHGALMGARGNSGVILYQIFEGMAQSAPNTDSIDGSDLARGLSRAAELAYQAVINPVEGTMLTVIRLAAEAARKAVESDSDMCHVLVTATDAARRALAQTPDMLPILKQAGVVDAGGKGLVVILDGLMRFAHGDDPSVATPRPDSGVATSMNFLDQVDLVHGVDEFGYCTNFLLTGDDLDIVRFREKMNELGSSAVVVGTGKALKVHIHSEHPGALLETALTFGELEDVRIDNMAAQTRRLLAERSSRTYPSQTLVPNMPIAVVAVASGNGLTAALMGMGANQVVDGGATTNPSTEEILRAVEHAPSDTVIILPNDSNVVAAAKQVVSLTRKTVRVVPSKSVPQGISALSALNLALDVDENADVMTEALGMVGTVMVTRASRDARIDGVSAREGEYIGLCDGRMVSAGASMSDVGLAALSTASAAKAELLTLFTGATADSSAVADLVDAINERFPGLTIEVVAGDQPHHDLIMAVE